MRVAPKLTPFGCQRLRKSCAQQSRSCAQATARDAKSGWSPGALNSTWMASPMILATVPSWANTTSVMPPTYSLRSAPSTSGFALSTSEVKPVISVKIVATSRHCTSMPSPSPPLAQHLDMADGLVDGGLEIGEIDRLGEEVERAAVHGCADVAHVAIGGDDDGRLLVLGLLQLGEQRQPVHPRHVDVGYHHVDMRMGFERLQRLESVMGEHERDGALADTLAEFLQHQRLEIGLVVNKQNGRRHAACPPPALVCAASLRGRVMMNSVKAPGRVSRSIVPPCCFTTMSWLIDRPSPVPSPAGLVVKKGLKIFSFTSGGMPVPLSRIRISTLVPRFLVDAASVGSRSASPASLRLVAA